METFLSILGMIALIAIIIWLLPVLLPLVIIIVLLFIGLLWYLRHKMMNHMDVEVNTFGFEEDDDEDYEERVNDDTVIDVEYVEHDDVGDDL